MKIWTILIALFLYPMIKNYRLDYGIWEHKRHTMKFRDLFEEKNFKNFWKMWQPRKFPKIQIKLLSHVKFRILTSVRLFLFFVAEIAMIFKHFFLFEDTICRLAVYWKPLLSSSTHSYDNCQNLPDILFTRLTGDRLA